MRCAVIDVTYIVELVIECLHHGVRRLFLQLQNLLVNQSVLSLEPNAGETRRYAFEMFAHI